MNIFSRIAISTANWGREYNGAKVPEGDIDKILGYSQCNGIDTLDCATAYGWDWTQANSYFNKVIKVNENDTIQRIKEILAEQPYCLMAHSGKFFGTFFPARAKCIQKTGTKTGVSVYDDSELNNFTDMYADVVQIPYSLFDRRFENYMGYLKGPEDNMNTEIHVRSIFLRGRIIADGIPAEECIKFVLANPYIDKIIIGADSFDQFRKNLDFVFKWNRLEKHDEKLLDPRQWQ